MLKNIYVTVTIIKKTTPVKQNFETFLFLTYFISRLKISNSKWKEYA